MTSGGNNFNTFFRNCTNQRITTKVEKTFLVFSSAAVGLFLEWACSAASIALMWHCVELRMNGLDEKARRCRVNVETWLRAEPHSSSALRRAVSQHLDWRVHHTFSWTRRQTVSSTRTPTRAFQFGQKKVSIQFDFPYRIDFFDSIRFDSAIW